MVADFIGEVTLIEGLFGAERDHRDSARLLAHRARRRRRGGAAAGEACAQPAPAGAHAGNTLTGTLAGIR